MMMADRYLETRVGSSIRPIKLRSHLVKNKRTNLNNHLIAQPELPSEEGLNLDQFVNGVRRTQAVVSISKAAARPIVRSEALNAAIDNDNTHEDAEYGDSTADPDQDQAAFDGLALRFFGADVPACHDQPHSVTTSRDRTGRLSCGSTPGAAASADVPVTERFNNV